MQAVWQAKIYEYTHNNPFKQLRMVFVTAHPDDEAMFFAPAIKNFKEDNEVFLLCLSNGNANGLGRTREKELETACRRLGFHEPPVIIDSPDLQDGMTTEWNPDTVAEEIKRFLRSKAGESEITTIVTFD
jgi:N-acetylglucosaminylphosphatidylinositol deacetylase